MKPFSLSAWVALFVFVLTIVGHFLGVVAVGYVPMALLVLFVGLEVRRVPRAEIIVATVLVTGGLAAAWAGGEPAQVIVAAIRHTQPFFLLFAAIAWLHVPTETSPSLRAARDLVLNQSAGRRFPVLLVAAHGLGATLNLAGVSLLAGVVRQAPSENLRRRYTRALTQGFLAASCWTPFFVAMSVGLSLVPGLVWSDVAPFGMAAALLLTGLSWAMDRLFCRRPDDVAGGDPAPAKARQHFPWRMVAVPATLFGAVIGVVEAFHMPIPVALALVTPVYAIGWMLILAGWRASPQLVTVALVRRVIGNLPNLRVEMLLFLAANLFGAGVSKILPPTLVAHLLDALALPPDALIVLTLLTILGLAALGVHPLVPVLVIGAVVPPKLLGLSPAIFCTAMVAMWGLGALISPFSGTTLFMRRVGDLSAWRLAWVWNGPYGVAGTVLLGAAIIVTRHLGID